MACIFKTSAYQKTLKQKIPRANLFPACDENQPVLNFY